jgi:hypothetical protein
MGPAEDVERFPRVLHVLHGGRETAYELVDDLVATHADGTQAPPAGSARPIDELEGGRLAIWDAAPPAAESHRVGPVYRTVPGGSLAVPTGRVFVQFGEATEATAQRGLLADAGFVLESVPGYAPHAAWVTPANGQVEDALRGLERLRDLPRVESVEPQLVGRSARRE